MQSSVALRLPSTNPQELRHHHQFREGFRLHFLHQIASVQLDRDRAYAQLRRYLLVHKASRYQSGHLPLARGKCLIESPHARKSAFLFASRAISLECDTNSVKYILVAEWLGKELDSAGFHCSHGHRYITMT